MKLTNIPHTKIQLQVQDINTRLDQIAEKRSRTLSRALSVDEAISILRSEIPKIEELITNYEKELCHSEQSLIGARDSLETCKERIEWLATQNVYRNEGEVK